MFIHQRHAELGGSTAAASSTPVPVGLDLLVVGLVGSILLLMLLVAMVGRIVLLD